MRAHFLAPLAPVLLVLSAAPVQAQTVVSGGAEAPAAPVQQVVVSASRYAQFMEDLALSMDVIGTRSLEQGQIIDIRDAAKSLPNVSVKRAPARFGVTGRGNPTGADGNAGFSIRGQGGNRVTMLVDGIRLPRSYINGSNAFGRDSVELGLVKRIEIVRGPTSALYGSDGLAGLVNFISHEPADFLRERGGVAPKLGGKAWLAHDSDDDGTTLGIALAGRLGPTAEWLISATGQRAGALGNMGSNGAANVDRTTPNPQHSRGESLLAKLVWRPAAGQRHVLTLEHVGKNNELELLSSRAKPPYTGSATAIAAAVVDEDSTKDSQRQRVSWDGRWALKSVWADQLSAAITWQDSHARDSGTTRRNDGGVRTRDVSYDERALQLTLQAEKNLPISGNWSQTLSYGLDSTRTDISSLARGFDPAPLAPFVTKRYFPDSRESTQAVYLQSEISDGRWTLTPGVRLDRYEVDVLSQDGYFPKVSSTPGKSLSGMATSPKLGVLFRANKVWSFYGNLASGFRAPEGQQVNSALEVSTARLLPNPDLRPEKSRNAEVGLRWQQAGHRVELSLFESKYSDLIVEKKNLGTANGAAATAANPTLFQTVNIDRATIRGVELKGRLAWGRAAGGDWSSPFAYGWLRGTDNTTGLRLNHIDPAKLNLGLRFETAAWHAQLDITHHDAKRASDLGSLLIGNAPNVGTQFTTPAATVLDLSGQWRIANDLRLNLAIGNLTDQKYWHWSDVQGLRTVPDLADAYTQSGRHVRVSLVKAF